MAKFSDDAARDWFHGKQSYPGEPPMIDLSTLPALIERLDREFDDWTPDPTYDARREAITALEALEAENRAMREALEKIAARPTHEGGCYYNNKFSVLEARAVIAALATKGADSNVG